MQNMNDGTTIRTPEDTVPIIDEVLRELYAERDAYAAEHGNDLERIFADLKEKERASEVALFRETDPASK
jgi:hypothetical protein